MKKKYEKACADAGLSEESIKEIRIVFAKDVDANRRRRNKAEKYNFFYLSLDDDSNGSIQIEDPDANVEDRVIQSIYMEQLFSYLNELKSEDRDFLHDCFDSDKVQIEKISMKYKMSKKQIYHRRDELVEYLRRRFDDKSTKED